MYERKNKNIIKGILNLRSNNSFVNRQLFYMYFVFTSSEYMVNLKGNKLVTVFKMSEDV